MDLLQLKGRPDLGFKEWVCNLSMQVCERVLEFGLIAYGLTVEVAERLHRKIFGHERRGRDRNRRRSCQKPVEDGGVSRQVRRDARD